MNRNRFGGIEYRNYRLQEDFPVFFLSGEQWKISDIPSSRLHFHNCVEIGLCHACSGILQVYDRHIPFQAGDITCIPSNVPHTTWSESGMRSRWSYLFFEPESLFRDVGAPGASLSFLARRGAGKFVFPRWETPELYPLACGILQELEREETNFRSCVKGLLFSLLVKLSRLGAGSSEAAEMQAGEEKGEAFSAQRMISILPALEFVEENYTEQFGIGVLAKACCLSETHFRRLFQQIMHMSPLAYLNGVRIGKACSLLCRSGEPVLSVAEKVGFSSISNFNRQFMRTMRTTPGEYRRRWSPGVGKMKNTPAVGEFTGWLLPEEHPE